MVLLLRLAWKILLLSGLGFWVGCGFSRQFSVEYFSLWMFMFGSSVFNAVLPMFSCRCPLGHPRHASEKFSSCQVLVFVGFILLVFGSASTPFVFVVFLRQERKIR